MINNLKIDNFKSIQSVSVDLKFLNILSGINGAGKSTLCQALLLIQQYVKTLSSPNGGDANFSINHKDFSLGKANDVLFEGASSDFIKLGFDCIVEKQLNNINFHLDANNKKMDHLRIVKEKSKLDFSAVKPFIETMKYLRPDRIGPSVIQNQNDEKVVEQRIIGSSGEYAYSYIDKHSQKYSQDILSDIENRVHIESLSDSLIDQVSSWLGEISPGINLKTKELEGTSLVNLSYSFNTKIGKSNDYRTTNVGFGITYCLPVILLCLLSKKGEIIIIDTPEAHLHPKGQVILGELLAKTAADGVQVIVETHSDHIINGVRKAIIKGYLKTEHVNFLHFQLLDDKKSKIPCSDIVSPKLSANGTFNNWPSGFFDEWTITNKELLELRTTLNL